MRKHFSYVGGGEGVTDFAKQANKKSGGNKIMIEETPARVMGFLGATLLSLGFLFAVSASNASFKGPETALYDPFNPTHVVSMLQADPFGPEHVVAFVDTAAKDYTDFLVAYAAAPAAQSFAYFNQSFKDDYAWVMDQTDTKIVAMAGLSDLLWQEPTPMAHPAPGSVAGAFTVHRMP